MRTLAHTVHFRKQGQQGWTQALCGNLICTVYSSPRDSPFFLRISNLSMLLRTPADKFSALYVRWQTEQTLRRAENYNDHRSPWRFGASSGQQREIDMPRVCFNRKLKQG